MKRFKVIASIVTIFYLLVLYVCYWWSDHNVATANWGSTSDIVIAVFTFMISYSTTLLLVAANSWREQQKYKEGSEFLSKFIAFYFQLMECRKKEVLIYFIVDELNNLRGKLVNATEGEQSIDYDKEIRKLEKTKVEIEKKSASSTMILNSLIEDAAKFLFVFDKPTEILEFMYEAQLIRSEFHSNFSPFFKTISKACLGEVRDLPKTREFSGIKEYREVVFITMFGYLQSFENLAHNEKESYTFDAKKWAEFRLS